MITATPQRITDATSPERSNSLLEVRDLKVRIATGTSVVHAVNGVSFSLEKGETLGIVGESGSGKSLACKALLNLLPEGGRREGLVSWKGRDTAQFSDREWRSLRGPQAGLIMQDPMTSLNPYLKISTQMIEALQAHEKVGRREARERAVKALEEAGITGAENRIDSWPHQFSGGMRQRVMIATALLLRPDLLVADEPTTALDVTVQAQILDLIKVLQQNHGMAMIFVSHDLGVVARVADRINVMYGGRFVESAPASRLLSDPVHPYTKALLRSLPERTLPGQTLQGIEGFPPSLFEEPKGCAFFDRCPQRAPDAVMPSILPRWNEVHPGHWVEACSCCLG